jgi:2-polyprenyl-6-methoxyphenol hydroxylase-like FAD-dependent oxidoreductase
MAEVLVLGAGLNGLATAMLLARDGHRVTVLERDAAEPSGSAEELWQRWERRGVNQFRQLHFMLPRWRLLIERELPAVIERLEAMGGARVNVVGVLPSEVTGGPREGDDRFDTVTARRPVLEAAVAAVAARTPGLAVRRGVAVTGLVTGREAVAGVPHVRRPLARGRADHRRAGDRRHRGPLPPVRRPGPAVATGLAAIGDAWACTNPSLGRGSSIGLLHACALRDLLREVGHDEPEKPVWRFDEVTETTVAPLYRMTLAFDRHRLAEITGEIAGAPYRTADATWAMSKALYAAALRDPDVVRASASVGR